MEKIKHGKTEKSESISANFEWNMIRDVLINFDSDSSLGWKFQLIFLRPITSELFNFPNGIH